MKKKEKRPSMRGSHRLELSEFKAIVGVPLAVKHCHG
jgi:hypothetical protein